MCIRGLSQSRAYMRLLLSNNQHVENSVDKDRMEAWGKQQSAVHSGGSLNQGEATPADKNAPHQRTTRV
jgi:hypothetical protein